MKETVECKTVRTDRFSMPYAVFGRGKRPLVLLNGLSPKSPVKNAQLAPFAWKEYLDRYRIYMLDRTTPVPEGYRIEDLAEDTAEAMRRLGVEQADVCGISQGGMMAMVLTLRHPELVRRLVLCSTTACCEKETWQKLRLWKEWAETGQREKLILAFAGQIYSRDFLERFQDVLPRVFADVTEEEWRQFVRLCGTSEDFDIRTELGQIHVPTLVLGARGDRLIRCEASEQIAGAIGGELFLYEEPYGHAVYDEAPDFRRRIFDFLQKENNNAISSRHL